MFPWRFPCRVVLEAAAGLYSEMGEISVGGSNSPCPMLEAAFGAEEISLDAGDGEIPVMDKEGAVLCEGLYYRQTMKAARGKVTGWFEDGTPAVAEVEYGKGEIRWTGTFPGAAVQSGRLFSVFRTGGTGADRQTAPDGERTGYGSCKPDTGEQTSLCQGTDREGVEPGGPRI